jgi:hypothetical protein
LRRFNKEMFKVEELIEPVALQQGDVQGKRID